MPRQHRESPPARVAGSLLLAHPAQRDAHFCHTVILVSEHNDEGAMGVVLNRPTGKTLGELGGDFSYGPLSGVPVYAGGPVDTQRLVIVAWESRPDGFRLHFGIEPDHAAAFLDSGVLVRAFLGYASWSGGQMEDELRRHAWVVTGIPADLATGPQDEGLWRLILGNEGDEWKILADEPDDPECN